MEKKEQAKQDVASASKRYHDLSAQEREAETKIQEAKQKLMELDEEEDAQLDKCHSRTPAWCWLAASQRTRREGVRDFLAGMASLRLSQEQSQEHQQPSMTSASASSSSRRPRPPGLVTSASRSSPSSAAKRPRSPPKPSSSSKGAYVD